MRKINSNETFLNEIEQVAIEIYQRDLEQREDIALIKNKYLQDTKYTLGYLSSSLEFKELSIFTNYMDWFGSLAYHLSFNLKSMEMHFENTISVFNDMLDKQLKEEALHFYKLGINRFISAFHLAHTKKIELDIFLNHLINMNIDAAYEHIMILINQGATIKDIYLDLLQPTLIKVGDLWHQQIISVAKEHYITAAIQTMIGKLYGKLFENKAKAKYSVTAVCAGDELHEIGMRMVADFFEMSKFDSYYLGSNIPIKVVLNHLIEKPTDLLAVSATTPMHLVEVKQLIESVKKEPRTHQIKIIVGGKIFNETPDLWKKIGADGFADNAEHAVRLGLSLLGDTND